MNPTRYYYIGVHINFVRRNGLRVTPSSYHSPATAKVRSPSAYITLYTIHPHTYTYKCACVCVCVFCNVRAYVPYNTTTHPEPIIYTACVRRLWCICTERAERGLWPDNVLSLYSPALPPPVCIYVSYYYCMVFFLLSFLPLRSGLYR